LKLRRLLGFGIPALVAGMLYVPTAAAQETRPQDVPSVGVLPVGTKTDDPNSGQWFIAALAPGESKHFVAGITNPAGIPQRVKLYLADLDFTANGAPEVAEVSDEVGTWGSVEQTNVEVPPLGQVQVGFTIKAPATADPGDHLGVIVAEGEPAGGGNVKVVKRVATRIYITLPGDAVPAFNIEKLQVERDSSFFTKEITTTVIVRNTGRVRLAPDVRVNGKKADGPELVMSRSVEQFVATTKVPFWGGPQSVRVDVKSRVARADGPAGPVRQARASLFVIPWVLLIALALMTGFVLLSRRLWQRRGGKYAEMRADMKRIERLLAEQRSGAPIDTREDDPEVAIKAAIKRAGRSGDKESEGKLKAKLAEHRAAKADAEADAREAGPAPVAPEPEPTPEPVVATTPRPEPEREPFIAAEPTPSVGEAAVNAAAASTSSYDWLLDDSPQPAAAEDPKEFYDSLRDAEEPAPPAAPPRTPVQSAMGPGYFVPDPAPPPAPEPAQPAVAQEPEPTPPAPEPAPMPSPAPPVADAPRHADAVPKSEHVDALAGLLRELATAPKKRQDALLQAARSYGVLTLRAHADLIDQLPPDVRVKLLPKQWAI
jgi:hypothetical protein